MATDHLTRWFDFSFRESHQRHRRVAFPLPGVSLAFRWVRPKPYPENPETLGGHLLKRRSETGLTQKAVADQLGVNSWTYLLWETNQTTPIVRSYPAIFAFLGYDPFPPPKTLPQRITDKRRHLGLTIKKAAELAGVDEGTFRRWEHGEWKPRASGNALQSFLGSTVVAVIDDPLASEDIAARLAEK